MQNKSILAGLGLAMACAGAFAAVSADEAARLKTDLTPLGGEKAGNADGSIPAWTGGYTTKPDTVGGRRADPFKDEKPLISITQANVAQYAGKLTEGSKAMLAKFPEYRIDVYKTHRTAAAPQYVYDNTFKNATRAAMNGDIPKNAFGGVPFPIPKTGAEVIWNHLLRWTGASWKSNSSQYQFTTDNRTVVSSVNRLENQVPYYLPDLSMDEFYKDPAFFVLHLQTSAPTIRAGDSVVARFNIDGSKDQSWVYLPGQRRVRKLPNACCDTPTPSTSGMMSIDELFVFTGRTDRFDWKLIGKQEMYIPYNTNKMFQPKKDADVLGPRYLKPEFLRWELHRVWIVEANLRAGQRHQAPRTRYYCDEDTWTCVLADRYDGNNQLWKHLWTLPFVAPDLPGVVVGTMGYNDMISGVGFVAALYNEQATQHVFTERLPDNLFVPDIMTGEGLR